MLFLIAHKVRGQPAFDIATREVVEGEEMWIIPTSGHRAYPYGYWFLSKLLSERLYNELLIGMPPNLRDHYTISASPKEYQVSAKEIRQGRDILATLGLLKPAEPIKRRI